MWAETSFMRFRFGLAECARSLGRIMERWTMPSTAGETSARANEIQVGIQYALSDGAAARSARSAELRWFSTQCRMTFASLASLARVQPHCLSAILACQLPMLVPALLVGCWMSLLVDCLTPSLVGSAGVTGPLPLR